MLTFRIPLRFIGAIGLDSRLRGNDEKGPEHSPLTTFGFEARHPSGRPSIHICSQRAPITLPEK